MQIFVKIYNKSNLIVIDNNANNKLDILFEYVEKKLNIHRLFFCIKSSNMIFTSFNTFNDMEEFTTFEVKIMLQDFKKLKINNIEYLIPDKVLLESNLCKNQFENKGIINITSDNIINNNFKKNLINDWMYLSYYLNSYLRDLNKSLKKFTISRPTNSKKLKDMIGDYTYNYMNSLDLDHLKDLASFSESFDISYIFESVCAFIACKFIIDKTVEEIKNLDLV